MQGNVHQNFPPVFFPRAMELTCALYLAKGLVQTAAGHFTGQKCECPDCGNYVLHQFDMELELTKSFQLTRPTLQKAGSEE